MKWGKEDATDEEIMEALAIAQATEVVERRKAVLMLLLSRVERIFLVVRDSD
mgnify:FL=1